MCGIEDGHNKRNGRRFPTISIIHLYSALLCMLLYTVGFGHNTPKAINCFNKTQKKCNDVSIWSTYINLPSIRNISETHSNNESLQIDIGNVREDWLIISIGSRTCTVHILRPVNACAASHFQIAFAFCDLFLMWAKWMACWLGWLTKWVWEFGLSCTYRRPIYRNSLWAKQNIKRGSVSSASRVCYVVPSIATPRMPVIQPKINAFVHAYLFMLKAGLGDRWDSNVF